MSLYPFIFRPILKERVWGGRHLERLYRKPLPKGAPIGESWEISDRPGDVSVIANGPLAGKDLRWVIENFQHDLLGRNSGPKRFPLLIKILDAREILSLQVHPPAHKAVELKGEPKTELWYVAHADPGAELFVGLKRGVARADFEAKIRSGTVDECFHRISVKAGDAMFLPSGRVHALGGGLVIFEIQENSDTTYRVFDWNRVGLDGKPRPLHIEQSLASINFEDFEPGLVAGEFTYEGPLRRRWLVRDRLFSVEIVESIASHSLRLASGVATIVGLVSGSVEVSHQAQQVQLAPGGFCLIAAALENVLLKMNENSRSLLVLAP